MPRRSPALVGSMPLQAVVVRLDGPYQVVNAPGAPVLQELRLERPVVPLEYVVGGVVKRALATAAASTRSSYTLVASRIR